MEGYKNTFFHKVFNLLSLLDFLKSVLCPSHFYFSLHTYANYTKCAQYENVYKMCTMWKNKMKMHLSLGFFVGFFFHLSLAYSILVSEIVFCSSLGILLISWGPLVILCKGLLLETARLLWRLRPSSGRQNLPPFN